MTAPGNLIADDAADLKEIRTSCPELDSVTHHVRDFAAMMRDLRGDQLPAAHSLINGLSRDIDAVTAGLSTHWNSGQVEGQVTKTKLLKGKGSDEPTSTSSASAYSSAPDPATSSPRSARAGPIG